MLLLFVPSVSFYVGYRVGVGRERRRCEGVVRLHLPPLRLRPNESCTLQEARENAIARSIRVDIAGGKGVGE